MNMLKYLRFKYVMNVLYDIRNFYKICLKFNCYILFRSGCYNCR